MNYVFCILGKSSSGKDTLYKALLKRMSSVLKPVVTYTTRHIRFGETNGVEYFFVDDQKYENFRQQGLIIEERTYYDQHGPWHYFTLKDHQWEIESEYDKYVHHIIIGTLQSFKNLQEYFKDRIVVPIYIEVEDGLRIIRSVKREQRQKHYNYEEVCRRYLTDKKDFSEENLRFCGIERRFNNDGRFDLCFNDVSDYISKLIEK